MSRERDDRSDLDSISGILRDRDDLRAAVRDFRSIIEANESYDIIAVSARNFVEKTRKLVP